MNKFLMYFFITAAGQVLIQYTINQILNAKYGVQLKQIEAIMTQEQNRYSRELLCPCPIKNIQNVNIELNKESIYNCDKCNKQITALVDINTALVTKPVDNLKAELIQSNE